MQVLTTVAEVRAARRGLSGSVGLVPTMGALHKGHLSLVQQARLDNACVFASIFVNPTQFGPSEDFKSYPRTTDRDLDLLRGENVDYVFMPDADEMYPPGSDAAVDMGMITERLEGASRTGHFFGVSTVVLKLFNIVQPQVAVFGSKDYQQLFLLREMVRQLNLPIAMVAGETVREADGLAMSSRNAYLKPAQRMEAPRLYRTLKLAVQSAREGHDFGAIEAQSAQYLTQLGWIVDYVAIRSAATLLPPQAGERALVVLAAARLGKTRLIDNLEFAL
jgi:pantoate--beta-alanine ligase